MANPLDAMPRSGKEELKKDPLIDLIIGNNKKKDLIPILEKSFEGHRRDAEVLDLCFSGG